jgi:hypothetical protein
MLPVFLLAMLTLGIMIRMVSVGENITHTLTDEMALTASEGTLSSHSLTFTGNLTRRVQDENGSDIGSAKVLPFKYRAIQYSPAAGKVYSDVIGATVTSDINLGFVNMFGVKPKVSATAVCRAFVGVLARAEKMPFSELEDDGDSHIVWVFPRAGERYHAENCSVIKNNPKEVLLTGSIRASYHPCELCDPGSAANGTLVYVFTGTGNAYHRGSCFIVERFVISMDRQDAKDKGYTACSICGGGN